MRHFKKLSIIIPVFNEEDTVQELIRRVERVSLSNLEKEIVVVDDRSSDRTAEILRQTPGVRAFFHERNRGKGAALKTGISRSTGDLILLQDADLEYNPDDYPALLRPLLEGRAELVMGSRFLLEKPRYFTKEGSPFFSHYLGNRAVIVLTNFLYGQRMTDYEGCYKVFTRKLIESTPIEADGFSFDNELVCKSLRRGYQLVEVPIHYHPRLYSEGKKITWRDGIKMLWTILKWRFLPFSRSDDSLF